jgi:hypothetical protein
MVGIGGDPGTQGRTPNHDIPSISWIQVVSKDMKLRASWYAVLVISQRDNLEHTVRTWTVDKMNEIIHRNRKA